MRVILDTQSNDFFQGDELEQRFDQRGGLCEVGEGHVVVTTDSIDLAYLAYWESIGFTLPHLVVAGPFEEGKTLSDLVISKPHVQQQIWALTAGKQARLEFFCIEESERAVASVLGIDPYCNFDVSIALGKKTGFRSFAQQIGLSVPHGAYCRDEESLVRVLRQIVAKGKTAFLKADGGTGGKLCGGMTEVKHEDDISDAIDYFYEHSLLVVEEKLDQNVITSVQWEIDEAGTLHFAGIFEQLCPSDGYSGVVFPTDIPMECAKRIEDDLRNRLYPKLVSFGAKGFYCCDVLIHDDMCYWIDFNPRKGAVTYVLSLVRQLQEHIFPHAESTSWRHEHFEVPSPTSISEIQEKLGTMIQPVPGREWLVVVTNPGVMDFGYVDLTSISTRGREEADQKMDVAKRILGE